MRFNLLSITPPPRSFGPQTTFPDPFFRPRSLEPFGLTPVSCEVLCLMGATVLLVYPDDGFHYRRTTLRNVGVVLCRRPTKTIQDSEPSSHWRLLFIPDP